MAGWWPPGSGIVPTPSPPNPCSEPSSGFSPPPSSPLKSWPPRVTRQCPVHLCKLLTLPTPCPSCLPIFRSSKPLPTAPRGSYVSPVLCPSPPSHSPSHDSLLSHITSSKQPSRTTLSKVATLPQPLLALTGVYFPVVHLFHHHLKVCHDRAMSAPLELSG